MPDTHAQSSRARQWPDLAAPLLAVFLALVLAGCQPRTVPITPGPAVPAGPLEQAEQAWSASDLVQAESLYSRLLSDPTLPRETRLLAFKRLSLSALANRHFHIALETLERWRAEDPYAVNDSGWQNAYVQATNGLPSANLARQNLADIFDDRSLPWNFRARAGLALAKTEWDAGQLDLSLNTLAGVYAEAGDAGPDGAQAYRAWLEQSLWSQLQTMNEDVLQRLEALAPAARQDSYPYVMLRAERARRQALDPGSWPSAWRTLNKLLVPGLLADPEPVRRLVEEATQRFGEPLAGVALALPLSGPYAPVSWKILRGASAAQWSLAMNGTALNVQVVNTDDPGWLYEIEDLPPTTKIVGGPLRREIFQQLLTDNATASRAFLTFLTALPDGSEGRDAWRFFPSPADQVRAQLDLVTNAFGFERFAALYPDEPYGRRMADIFRDEITRRRLYLVTERAYPPKSVEDWSAAVKKLLDGGEADATFLPDGWTQAEGLIPLFFFHSDERMVFLGNTLWQQALESPRDLDMRNFSLALFPGPFDPKSQTPGVLALRQALDEQALGEPDFWVALGWDFVRFAQAASPLETDRGPAAVNARLASLPDLDFSLAPIHYGYDGVARQDLFLFQPASQGMAPLDQELLIKRREEALSRQEWVEETLKKQEQGASQ